MLLPVTCADWTAAYSGSYWVQNNTWGKEKLTGWSQCIGIGDGGPGSITARWIWDWPNSGTNVKAYPEVIFGQKPGTQSSTAALPRKVSDIQSATVAWDIESDHTGSGNTALELWLTDVPGPVADFSAPPVTHEIMIWLEAYGGMHPGGAFTERVTLDGVDYDVYIGDDFGEGWRYIAFERVTPQLGIGGLDLVSFLAYLRSKHLVTGNEYVASIELGNEVISGAGQTRLHSYTVSVD